MKLGKVVRRLGGCKTKFCSTLRFEEKRSDTYGEKRIRFSEKKEKRKKN